MKLLIILFISIFVLDACSTNSTGPEEKNRQLKATSFATKGSNEVFATTPEGLYRSDDNGGTWKRINSMPYGLVSISPNETIFCTHHKKTGTYTSEETLLRSTDDGKTFITTGWIYEVSANGLIAIDFNNQGQIFAWKLFDGLYRSIDQGENWDRLTYGILNAPSFIAPDDMFYASFDGVFRSEDNGDNWLKVLEVKDNTGDTGYFCVALAFNSTDRVFCAVNAWHFMGDSVETGMIYYSDDKGNNWNKGSALNNDIAHLNVNSKDNIFTITWDNQIFICIDNGMHWNKVSSIPQDESIKKMAINNTDQIFIITSKNEFSNIYRSIDDGSSWEQIWPYNK